MLTDFQKGLLVGAGGMALLAYATACTPMPHKYVPGPAWEHYRVTEHRVGCREMLAHCLPGVPFPIKPLLVAPMGCATINFERQTCDIYTCALSPGFVLEHEREHCRGLDHGGQIQRAWDDRLRTLGSGQ